MKNQRGDAVILLVMVLGFAFMMIMIFASECSRTTVVKACIEKTGDIEKCGAIK